MFIRPVLLLSVFLSSNVKADNYDVQIGAFRNPDPARFDVPANVGELRITEGSDGLIRFLVGPFANRTEATRARDELRASGYAGAFIRETKDAGSAAGLSASTPVKTLPDAESADAGPHSEAAYPSQGDLEKLSTLSDEERREIVYLDGRLHKKIGDEFIPLAD